MKYRLFGMKPTGKHISRAAEYGYFRAAPGYLLVYTRGRKPPNSIPVRAEQLPDGDRLWLQQCNEEIIRETVEKSPDIQEKMIGFLAHLETELEKEQKKLGVGKHER